MISVYVTRKPLTKEQFESIEGLIGVDIDCVGDQWYEDVIDIP